LVQRTIRPSFAALWGPIGHICPEVCLASRGRFFMLVWVYAWFSKVSDGSLSKQARDLFKYIWGVFCIEFVCMWKYV